MKRKVTINPKCPHCGETNTGVKEYNKKSVRFRCKTESCDNDSFTLSDSEIDELEKAQDILVEEIVEELLSDEEFEGCDKEIVEQNVRLAKSKQKFQDMNRVERKAFRENARVENAIEELYKNFTKLLERDNFKGFTIKHDTISGSNVGVIQLSDLHFGEQVNLVSNKYNWTIASKRLKKLVSYAKKFFKAIGITEICLFLTGDLMNSDRRLDEILTNSENRTQTMFIASELLSDVIKDLNLEFNVNIASVTGNESRVKDDVSWGSLLTDNYDYSLHNILQGLFAGCDGVRFLETAWDEAVIEVAGKNFLLVHGHAFKGGVLDKQIQNLKGKFASQGIIIDYVIFGHIHSAYLSDTFSRSASLVGNNDYSEKALNLAGKASQNLYFVNENDIHAMKVDLQNTDGVDGYDIKKKYENYTEVKNEKNEVIFKVVI